MVVVLFTLGIHRALSGRRRSWNKFIHRITYHSVNTLREKKYQIQQSKPFCNLHPSKVDLKLKIAYQNITSLIVS